MARQISIRTYVLAVLISLGLLMSALFSWQSASYFLSAFDSMVEHIMLDAGKHHQAGQRNAIGIHTTTDWQQVPEPVRQQFGQPPKEFDQLQTRFLDWVYFAPPEQSFQLMKVKSLKGETVYVSKYRIKKAKPEDEKGSVFGWIDPMVQIALVGLFVLIAFIVLLLLIFRSIAKPVDGLYQWVRDLSLESVEQAPPRFPFTELNVIADLNYQNIKQVKETLVREQAFLSHASHELRTPIATIRSNAALLNRLSEPSSEKEQRVRDRIQRASLTMKDMTETLLWLSREDDASELIYQECDLPSLIEQLVAELNYLTEGKEIEVKLALSPYISPMPVTVCKIVLTNLVRNAFQHTQIGEVEISQQGCEVVMINRETKLAQVSETSLGFGIGTKLVQKIAQQFAWPYSASQSDSGYRVSIQFTPRQEQ